MKYDDDAPAAEKTSSLVAGKEWTKKRVVLLYTYCT